MCVAVTTLAQSSSLPKSACRVVLNVAVHGDAIIGDRSAVQLRFRGSIVVMYTNHTYNAMRVL